MKKFTEQEWREFQERVKQASIGEKTIGANFFSVSFKVWKDTDSNISLQKESGFYNKASLYHFHPARGHLAPLINPVKTKKEKKKPIDRNRIGLLFIFSILLLIVIIRIFLM